MRDIVSPPDDADKERNKNILVVPGRARNSAEFEDHERRGIAHAKTLDGQLPMQFRDGKEIEPLSKQDLQILKELGVSPAEWLALIERT